MKSFAVWAAAGALLLSGCATTIRSDVMAFNEWPSDLQDKSYVFEMPAGKEDTLEYRNYLMLLGNELNKMGFHPAASGSEAKLKVEMHYSVVDIPTRVLTADDPFYSPYWGPRWRGYYGWGHRPFGTVMAEEQIQHNYQRQLRVVIDSTSNQKLYDVTVVNTSRVASTPMVMPALVQSAFAGFPGQNGVPRRVELTLPEEKPKEAAPQAAKM